MLTSYFALPHARLVRSLYTWQGDGADELPLEEGATYELSSGPNGGENYADGWWEGKYSSIPLQYCTE